MRKEDLVRALVQKSRTKTGGEAIHGFLEKQRKSAPKLSVSLPKTGKKPSEKKSGIAIAKGADKEHSRKGTDELSVQTAPKKREVPKKRENASDMHKRPLGGTTLRPGAKNGIQIQTTEGASDRLVLLVRDPYWLHAFWELSAKTLKRAEVAMGHFWHSASPVLRLYRVFSDGSGSPKRQPIRDIRIHGGVNNWYIEVSNPPSKFQVELGYLSREQKFYPLLSSGAVETPQRQIVDELDKLDGNWRGVADDLGRIFKLSGGDSANHELKQVFEDKLQRPMSDTMLSRYRASRQGALGEKTRRNFTFGIDADVIIHGQTDPSVQVTIRNEPIKINPDGSFSVRFSLPEKRHVFSIEAEGSDGVEKQRVVLTVERNTRILETLFHEPSEDD